MLKLFFSVLLLGNLVLFAYGQGYLGGLFPDGREPARMGRQIKADSVKLIAPEPALLAGKPASVACLEIGNFDHADASRFEQRVGALKPAVQFTRGQVVEPSRHMVLIASQGSKDAADRKAGELRRLGITDFFVMPEGEQRWGISLGIFKTEEAARAHLAAVTQKGVHSARLGRFGKPETKSAFQFRAADGAVKDAMTKILADFPKQDTRGCDPDFG